MSRVKSIVWCVSVIAWLAAVASEFRDDDAHKAITIAKNATTPTIQALRGSGRDRRSSRGEDTAAVARVGILSPGLLLLRLVFRFLDMNRVIRQTTMFLVSETLPKRYAS